uniref:DUF834 domain-containing protein n=1 Tax=Oryza sativa subsp. japonica TaxID=39947 RepID=Q8W2R9_ORYSJ|nr:Hypothetical protein [Oryza sativa]
MASSPARGGKRTPTAELDGEGVDGVARGLANPTTATVRLGDGSSGDDRRPKVAKAAAAGGARC